MASPATPLGRLGDPKHTLYLVDVSSFIFRAFFAVRPLHTKAGEPTNAVYGVATMLARLHDEARPERLAVVYDSKEPSFRKELYTEYKANRSAPPEELIPQFDRIEQLVRAMEMPSYRQSGVEADDLIATLTCRWRALDPQHRVVIVSSDKDLMQLVDDRAQIWDTMTGKIYGPAEVEEKFGVKPEQIRDYLALVGDSSDNIPGVPSVGPKTAADLLREHGTLDAILAAAQAGKIAGKKGEVLKAHEADARLSARLATVHVDLPLELDPGKVAYRFTVSEDCARLLRELDFNSLLARWQAERPLPVAEEPRAAAQAESADTFRTLNTEAQLKDLLSALEKRKEFGFDLETTSLNPREARICGIAICHDPAYAWYIPVGHRADETPQLPEKRVLEALKPFLEDPRYRKIGQNLKYDWSVLREHGLSPDGIGADTMVAAYVLDPEGRHNLETLASHYLGYAVTTYEQVCGKGKDAICFDQVPIAQATRYSAEDALIAVRLWDKLRPSLEKEGLMQVFAEIDLPLVPILTRMELQGVCIDTGWLRKLGEEFRGEIRAIEERIQAYTQGPINLNSPKQLGQLLFEELKLPTQGKTKTGYSTDAKVLDALSPLHEVPRLLLEYREISKLMGTYVEPLPGMQDAKTGKIHAGFHQTVAATGRLSSADPNLQNIPVKTERGRRIRRAFIPSPGNRLVSADYSQIELRLLAHMSGDKELVASFRKEEDVHARTASEIFEVKPAEVSDRQRGIAKAINFGLMYGKTPFGLAQELKIPQKEAKEIIDRYFQRYSGVKKFLDGLIFKAREDGYACTLSGRKRRLPDLRSANPAVRGVAERMAMNTPIQGTAADLMKIAMIGIDDRLRAGKHASKLILQVHDEFVLDCPVKEVGEMKKLLADVMENAMKLDVPLRVNASDGESWADL
jgi:DNA polymerase I